MTPRPRYALPWPPDCDPPAEEPDRQVQLWVGSCPRCSGEGVVTLDDLIGVDGDAYTCPTCLGSGVESAATTARRLRDD